MSAEGGRMGPLCSTRPAVLEEDEDIGGSHSWH